MLWSQVPQWTSFVYDGEEIVEKLAFVPRGPISMARSKLEDEEY